MEDKKNQHKECYKTKLKLREGPEQIIYMNEGINEASGVELTW